MKQRSIVIRKTLLFFILCEIFQQTSATKEAFTTVHQVNGVIGQGGGTFTTTFDQNPKFPSFEGATSITDDQGNGWIFGGAYSDGTSTSVTDKCVLYGFDSSTGKGAKLYDVASGTGNTLGLARSPGIRKGAMLWHDGVGRLYVFGGTSSDGATYYASLFYYQISTKQFHVADSSCITYACATSVTGFFGYPYARPSERSLAATWSHDGTLYMFGGKGSSSVYSGLWEYHTTNQIWYFSTPSTVMTSPDLTSFGSVPGTIETFNPANIPGARYNAMSVKDFNGNLWLFVW